MEYTIHTNAHIIEANHMSVSVKKERRNKLKKCVCLTRFFVCLNSWTGEIRLNRVSSDGEASYTTRVINVVDFTELNVQIFTAMNYLHWIFVYIIDIDVRNRRFFQRVELEAEIGLYMFRWLIIRT